MICPRCKSALSDFHIEGVDLDICESCKGVWFDKEEFSYYAMLEKDLPEFRTVYPLARKTSLKCPRCEDFLEEMKFSARENLLIDRCRKCHGLWFDAQELARAKEISAKYEEKDSRIHQVMEVLSREENLSPSYAKKPIRPIVISAATLAFLAFALLVNTFISSPGRTDSSLNPSKVCRSCDGTGKIMKLCSVCYGSGKVLRAGTSSMSRSVACDECGGSGGLIKQEPGRCAHCNGSGWTRIAAMACPKCRGKGEIKISDSQKVLCPECQGYGKMDEDIRVCHECFGTGEAVPEPGKACPKCHGTGMLARVESGGSACAACNGLGRIAAGECAQCRGTGQL